MTTRIVLTSLFVYGALAGSPAVSHANDRAEQTRIETKLKKDADLRGVTVKCERVVTLSGKVPSESDKIRAERLASLTGVSKVDNQIEVSDKVAKDRIDDQAETNKDRAQVRADIEKNRIDAEAEAAKARLDHKDTDKAHPTVGDDVSDAWITTKLKSKFTTESAFKGSAIHVTTDAKGTVTLRGTVPTDSAHREALEVARATKGVHDVRDDLKVEAIR